MDLMREGCEIQAMESLMIYEDARRSSRFWHTDQYIYYPLTDRQFDDGSKFRIGRRVKMKIYYDKYNKTYLNLTVANIEFYEDAETLLGSYNMENGFKGERFIRALMLK